jgi:opacity protein-like surface antigen
MKCWILLFFILLWTSAGVYANQEPNPSGHPVQVGIWTAHSPYSSTFLFSTTHQTRFTMMGLEIRHVTLNLGRIELGLSSDIILAGRTSYPKNGISGPRDSKFGAGAVPVRFNIPLIGNLSTGSLHFDAGLGFIYFEQPFPNQYGALFNVTIDAGFGYSYHVSNSTSIGINYRFHHLSNAGSGELNPGVDSNFFMLGIRSRIH